MVSIPIWKVPRDYFTWVWIFGITETEHIPAADDGTGDDGAAADVAVAAARGFAAVAAAMLAIVAIEDG